MPESSQIHSGAMAVRGYVFAPGEAHVFGRCLSPSLHQVCGTELKGDDLQHGLPKEPSILISGLEMKFWRLRALTLWNAESALVSSHGPKFHTRLLNSLRSSRNQLFVFFFSWAISFSYSYTGTSGLISGMFFDRYRHIVQNVSNNDAL